MREVSCKVFTLLFKEMEKSNQPFEILCQDIPYDLNYLSRENENIEWEVYCRIMANTRVIWNDDDYIRIGIQLAEWRLLPFFSALIGFFLNIKDAYKLMTDFKGGLGKQYFHCIISQYREISDHELEIKLELPLGYTYCREFFLITKGFFIACPKFLKLGYSNVEMNESDRGAAYKITYPQSRDLLSRIRRIIALPASRKVAAQELKKAFVLLADRYNQLEQSRTKILNQTKQLEAAYSISQIIRSDLDLDFILKAVAESLIKVAGIKGVNIHIDAIIEGEHIYRTLQLGDNSDFSKQFNWVLEGHGHKIGGIKLQVESNSISAEIEKILDYIIPTISMEILNAISYKIVDDYRSKLELKVEERTSQLNYTNKELALTIDKLKRFQAAQSRFFANISHEFRTPLTLILGPIDQIISESDDNRVKKHAGIIRQNAIHLLGLINQLLDLSKLDAGKLTLQASEVDIVSFIRGITSSFESIAEKKNIKLNFRSTRDRILIAFDQDQILKVMINLLSNAFKFTREGGEISVSVSDVNDRYLAIKIKDTGIGISRDDLPKIFDRFYQADSSYSGKFGGSGIGLALTKELVELHKGFIRVSSKLNEGSEFIIELPFDINQTENRESNNNTDNNLVVEAELVSLDDNLKQEKLLDESNSNLADGDKMIILIVEDNADVRNFIKESLGNQFVFKEAADGKQGFNLAESIIPDLIISDVMMPVMDGNELVKRIKNEEKTCHIPIILLTARSSQESKIEGLSTGADDYLTKPFDIKELLIRIKNLINVRRRLHDKYRREDCIAFNKFNDKKISDLDEHFMCKVINIIERHLSEEDFSVEQFGNELSMSRVQIYRKIKALTGLTPSKYISSIRLNTARRMILDKKGNISEIAYLVGFGSPTYFTRCFKEEFGCLPSDLIK
jgi:signal transduction histidine kinase/DNA-binding response OmpR family regulator